MENEIVTEQRTQKGRYYWDLTESKKVVVVGIVGVE